MCHVVQITSSLILGPGAQCSAPVLTVTVLECVSPASIPRARTIWSIFRRCQLKILWIVNPHAVTYRTGPAVAPKARPPGRYRRSRCGATAAQTAGSSPRPTSFRRHLPPRTAQAVPMWEVGERQRTCAARGCGGSAGRLPLHGTR